MMNVAQINLNHCAAAQDLLAQTVKEKKIDVILRSEPYKSIDGSSWIDDTTKKAAIWTCGNHALQSVGHPADHFVSARIKGVYFYSC